MRKICFTFSFLCLFLFASHLQAIGTGSPLFFAESGSLRLELDGGAGNVQFAKFRYGDVREDFPILFPPLAKAFDERPHAWGYYLGLRTSTIFYNTEVYAHFGYSNANHNSHFIETDPVNVVFVPYIDGEIHPVIGGTVVGLFFESDQSLKRNIRSYEGEVGFALQSLQNRFVTPLFYLAYQRVEQRDHITTTLIINPSGHELFADINANNYCFGISLRSSLPLFWQVTWLNRASFGLEIASAHYEGHQHFSGDVPFDDPLAQFAKASDHETRVGFSFAYETGLRILQVAAFSLSLLGNINCTNVFPYVRYPEPITGTLDVDGPARLAFTSQLNWGGGVNLSFLF